EGNADLGNDDDRDDQRRRAPPFAKSTHSLEGTLRKFSHGPEGMGRSAGPTTPHQPAPELSAPYAACGSTESAWADVPASEKSRSVDQKTYLASSPHCLHPPTNKSKTAVP